MINLRRLTPFQKKEDETVTIEKLIKTIKTKHSDADTTRIQKAYDFAKKWHGNQKRKTGEPFIVHPLNVAYILATMELGQNTITAALLHDIHEDTAASMDEIQKTFGVHIANIVDGVTKLGRVRLSKKHRDEAEIYNRNLQKMFMAMGKDIRVILIKLADRLHNMETLAAQPPEKQQSIAKETLEIYAPIANRLGMGEIRGQLEDLAFMYTYPQQYEWLIKIYQKNYQERKVYIEKVKKNLKKRLQSNKLPIVSVEGRAKHLYSLYKKLRKYDGDISKIYDLIAVRVIVKTIPECYQVLGETHQHWKPLVGRIKDYIATPKPNNYRSLHTTVFAMESKIVEIQIRTEEMHKEAEYGIAAHWIYSDSKQLKDFLKRFITKSPEDEMRWIKQLSQWKDSPSDEREKMIERLKIDYFNDRIFVFTPHGDVRDLPVGATIIDFAYTIHTEVGHHCKEATINREHVKPYTTLKNGDIVHVVIEKEQRGPKREWLEFVQTQQARSEIKKWFNTQDAKEHRKLGEEILEQSLHELLDISLSDISKPRKRCITKELHLPSFENVLEQIGCDKVQAFDVIKKLYSTNEIFSRHYIHFQERSKKTQKKQATDEENYCAVTLAPCCSPSPGENTTIVSSPPSPGILHNASCPKIRTSAQTVTGFWIKEKKPLYTITLSIHAVNRIGLLRDIADVLNTHSINIENITTSRSKTQKQSTTNIRIGINIPSLNQLKIIIDDIKRVDGVFTVQRQRNK